MAAARGCPHLPPAGAKETAGPGFDQRWYSEGGGRHSLSAARGRPHLLPVGTEKRSGPPLRRAVVVRAGAEASVLGGGGVAAAAAGINLKKGRPPRRPAVVVGAEAEASAVGGGGVAARTPEGARDGNEDACGGGGGTGAGVRPCGRRSEPKCSQSSLWQGWGRGCSCMPLPVPQPGRACSGTPVAGAAARGRAASPGATKSRLPAPLGRVGRFPADRWQTRGALEAGGACCQRTVNRQRRAQATGRWASNARSPDSLEADRAGRAVLWFSNVELKFFR